MIKKIIFAIAVALPMVASAQKFGIVSADAIMSAMPETTAANTQLAEASKKYETEFKTLSDEIDKKYTEYQELAADTPESIKERRMQELQELYGRAQQFQSTAQQDLERQRQQLFAPVQQKLVDAIKAVGQEGNYTFIFQSGAPLYEGKDVVDITDAVKAKLGIK